MCSVIGADSLRLIDVSGGHFVRIFTHLFQSDMSSSNRVHEAADSALRWRAKRIRSKTPIGRKKVVDLRKSELTINTLTNCSLSTRVQAPNRMSVRNDESAIQIDRIHSHVSLTLPAT